MGKKLIYRDIKVVEICEVPEGDPTDPKDMIMEYRNGVRPPQEAVVIRDTVSIINPDGTMAARDNESGKRHKGEADNPIRSYIPYNIRHEDL
jgi:hypothetical protein